MIELAEAALGTDCHIIGQTAWRSRPGFIGGELHADYLAMELPESLLADPAFELPKQVCTAHLYLDDIDADLCPTLVIPGSHRAGRRPRPGETQWHGRAAEPVLCKAGDLLLFRSDLWHAGSRNRTAERCRYLLQIHYGRRMVAQKFSPYLHFRCWPPPRRASVVCSASTRRPNTTAPLAPNLHRPRPAAPARPLTRIRQMRIRHDQQS